MVQTWPEEQGLLLPLPLQEHVMAEGAETERCHTKFHISCRYYCFRHSHIHILRLASLPPDMHGGDRGIVLLSFASPVCQNAFLENLWSRAVPSCFIRIPSKAMKEIFQWITRAMAEITSLVMIFHGLGKGYYWEKRIHLTKGS